MGKLSVHRLRIDWSSAACWSLCLAMAWALRHPGVRGETLAPMWTATSYLAILAAFCGPAGKWRVLSAAIAASVTPIPCDHAFLMRTLLVPGAVYFAHAWPHRAPVSGWSVGLFCWPAAALFSYESDWTTPGSIDVVTMFLVATAMSHIVTRGFRYGRRPQTHVLAFGTLLASAIWISVYADPSRLTAAIAYAPLYTVLAPPLWHGACKHPARLITVAATLALTTI